jgi:phage terminase large subunit-like protein
VPDETPNLFADLFELPAARRPGPKPKTDDELRESDSWRLPARKKAARREAERSRFATRPRPRVRIWNPESTIRELPGYDPHRDAGKRFVFRPELARRAIAWIHEHITHVKGEKAAGPDPLALERWQQGGIANLFGWVDRKTGLRRFRHALWFLPRKNGKTTIAAAITNLVAFTDDEPGAELYSAAADREQARLVFGQAAGQCRQDLELADQVRVYHNSIAYLDSGAVYKALSAEAGTKHGLNSNFVVVDELHAQPDRELVDVLVTSTGARRQPLVLYITTSDFARVSICNEIVDYAIKVRDGVIRDPTFLPLLYYADNDDDWTLAATWRRANPNYDVIPGFRDYLRRQAKKAQDEPAFENTFRRLHLNQRTEQDVRLISLRDWDACTVEDLQLAGPAFAGLDLSSTEDLSAFVLYFPDVCALLAWFWIPGENAAERERRDRVPYLTWARQGFIELTEGNVIDYNRIRFVIREQIATKYAIREIGVDPWNSAHIQRLLSDDGFDVVQYPQGYRDMNPPTRELLRLLASAALQHSGNPVLRWCAANVAAETSSDGQMIRPSKRKSTERIDGIVAGLIAIGRAITIGSEPISVYDETGLTLL